MAGTMKKKGTSIIFLNSQKQILLFLRDNKKDIPYPNRWDILGGHIEEGESPQACIMREMREEIGIALNRPSLFNVYDMDDRIEYTFSQSADFDVREIKLREGQRLRWFSEEEIRSLSDEEIAFNFRRVILDFFETITKPPQDLPSART